MRNSLKQVAPKIDLPDINLRDLDVTDIPAWYDYLKLPHVVEHTSWNLANANDLKPIVEQYNSTEAESKIRFAIQDLATQRLIGTIGFTAISVVNKTAEIAYDIHPDYWRRGIATATCLAVTNWGFAVKGWVRIQATTLDTNLGSQKVLERCGFELEGRLRNYKIVRGVPREFWMYGAMPDRFLKSS